MDCPKCNPSRPIKIETSGDWRRFNDDVSFAVPICDACGKPIDISEGVVTHEIDDMPKRIYDGKKDFFYHPHCAKQQQREAEEYFKEHGWKTPAIESLQDMEDITHWWRAEKNPEAFKMIFGDQSKGGKE